MFVFSSILSDQYLNYPNKKYLEILKNKLKKKKISKLCAKKYVNINMYVSLTIHIFINKIL